MGEKKIIWQSFITFAGRNRITQSTGLSLLPYEAKEESPGSTEHSTS